MTHEEYLQQLYEGASPKAQSEAALEAAPPFSRSAHEQYLKNLYGEAESQNAPPSAPPRAPNSPEMERQIEQARREAALGIQKGAVRSAYGGDMGLAQAHYNDLVRQGASPKEALFLTAAAAAESGFRSDTIHDQGTGYGLYGHRLDRRDAMFKFTGTNAPSPSMQNAFALRELRSRPEYEQLLSAKNARDLAIAQMHYERPAGYTPDNPTGGHNFAGRMENVNKFATFMGKEGNIEASHLTPQELERMAQGWSPRQAFSSGAALGFGPQIQAGLRTRTYPWAAPEGPEGEAYRQELERLRSAEAAYKERYPLVGYGTEALGSGVSGAAPLGAAGRLTTMGLRSAGVPEAALRFLSGEAGREATSKVAPALWSPTQVVEAAPYMEGKLGTATRIGSSATAGALQGAGQIGLEATSRALGGSLGDQETPLSQQLTTGAVIGAAANPLFAHLISPHFGDVFDPQMREGARSIAQRASQKYDIPVLPGQFALENTPADKAASFMSGELANKQVQKFNDELRDIVSMENLAKPGERIKAKSASPDDWETLKKGIQNNYDLIVKKVSKPMQLDAQTANRLAAIESQAFAIRDVPGQNSVLNIIKRIRKDLADNTMKGEEFQSYTHFSTGAINKALGALGPSERQFFGREFTQAMDGLFAANNPKLAPKYKEVKSVYRDLKTLEKATAESSMFDPQKVAKLVAKRGSSSDLGSLAPVGQYLPQTGVKGGAVLPPPKQDFFRKFGKLTLPASAAPLGLHFLGAESVPVVGNVLSALGPKGQWMLPAATAGYYAYRGGQNALNDLLLKSPHIRKDIINQTLAPSIRQYPVKTATRATVAGEKKRAQKPAIEDSVQFLNDSMKGR